MSGQKKTHSAAEAIINVLVGFGVSYAANLVVLPCFGFNVSHSAAFGIGIIYTVISLVRSYILRRIFNRIMVCQAK